MDGSAGGQEIEVEQLEHRGGRETVLLVEDEESILEVAEAGLRQLGYRVLAAGSPAEAPRAASAHVGSIDLLVTDVVMPGMNGKQLAEELRRTRPGLACLSISGYTANVIAERGIQEEGVDLLPKPFPLGAPAATTVRVAPSAGTVPFASATTGARVRSPRRRWPPPR
ncbi:MAG TPA: response regulator [Spirochaetia bacterium]|nr:response regulator [Spirochaetia bacterium]